MDYVFKRPTFSPEVEEDIKHMREIIDARAIKVRRELNKKHEEQAAIFLKMGYSVDELTLLIKKDGVELEYIGIVPKSTIKPEEDVIEWVI